MTMQFTELELVSATIGEFSLTGTISLTANINVDDDTLDYHGLRRTIAQYISLHDIDNVVIHDMEILHPAWDEAIIVTQDDDNTINLNLWTSQLKQQSDLWFDIELSDTNDLWEEINE